VNRWLWFLAGVVCGAFGLLGIAALDEWLASR
jgi:hypothetical protein